MKIIRGPKRKSFQTETGDGEILIGDSVVKIENGNAINYSRNVDHNDDNNERKYNLEGNSKIDEEYEQQQQRQKILPKGSHHNVKEQNLSSCQDFMMNNEEDLLDKTFDSMESFACQERSNIYPSNVSSPSPVFSCRKLLPVENNGVVEGYDIEVLSSYINQQEGNNNNNIQVIESEASYDPELEQQRSDKAKNIDDGTISKRKGGDIFGFMSGKFADILLRQNYRSFSKLSEEVESVENPPIVTNDSVINELILANGHDDSERMVSDQDIMVAQLPVSQQQQGQDHDHEMDAVDFISSRLNRENTLLDIEGGSSKEDSTSSNKLNENQDRLEKLRQQKRAIENKQLSAAARSSSQIIVIIPKKEKETAAETESYTSTNKLQIGSSLSTKQIEEFHFRKRVYLTVTIFLISIGTIILAMGIFWPTKHL
jgi:hypothetical protein